MEIAGRVKNPEGPRRYIDKYLVPKFGAKHPAEITPEEAARLLGRVGRKAPTAANDLLRYMKRIFRFGVRRRRLPVSPVSDFNSRDAGGVERHRDRALSQDELVIVLPSIAPLRWSSARSASAVSARRHGYDQRGARTIGSRT